MMIRRCRRFGPRLWKILLCLYVVLLVITIWSQYFKNDFQQFKKTTVKRHVKKSDDRRAGSQSNFSRAGKDNFFPIIKLEKGIGCTERKYGGLSLSNQILPITALASPHRSGNTWVRHLLQMATGIGTSAVYCDRQLQQTGFPYECSHKSFNRTIVVKTHQRRRHNASDLPNLKFDRVILLIRDPYNYIVANIHRYHLDVVKEDHYFKEDSEWRKLRPVWLNSWNEFNHFWLIKFKGPVYPLLYSNLLDDTETEVRKVLNFLRVTYTEADIRCAINNKEGNFHRKPMVWTRIKDITELFENTLKAKIESHVKALSKHLKNKYRLNWVNETHIVRK